MKKGVAAIVLCSIMIAALSACGETSGTQNAQGLVEQAVQEQSAEQDQTEESDDKVIPEVVGEEGNLNEQPVPEKATVYFTSDISAEGLVCIYEQLDWHPEGNVAVKISTGEPPASNYLRPELIGDLVQMLDRTIVECNRVWYKKIPAVSGICDGICVCDRGCC